MAKEGIVFHTIRLLYVCLTVLIVVAPGMPFLSNGVAATQLLDPDQGLYQSPAYGYLLRWNPESWQETNASSGGEIDVLELRSATTLVRFAAFERFGGDPDRCLEDAAERFRRHDVHAFAQARYDDGTIAAERGDGHAYGGFLVVALAADGHETEYVVQIECRTLLRDQAVLEVTSLVASMDYASGADDGMHLVDNIALPRHAYVVQPNVTQPIVTERTYFGAGVTLDLRISGYTDNLAGRADATLPAPASGTRWAAAEVMIQNTGDNGVEIDAGRIVARDAHGTGVYPTYYEWTEATGPPEAAVQAIAPGQSGTATLYYEVATGVGMTAITCGCGPNPDIPIVIGYLQPDPYAVFPPPPSRGCNPLGWETPRIVVDRSGVERVTLTATQLSGGENVQILLAIENSGTEPLTLDVNDFSIVVDDTTPYRADAVTWDLASDAAGMSSADTREVAVGERVVARLAVVVDQKGPYNTQIYYLGPQDGQLHDLAWFCGACGCGGGGRPKIVVSH
jgi:hypothetical protein